MVIEDIFYSSAAEKSKTLKLCPDKPHLTPSRHTAEKDYLQRLETKTPIKWGRMDDERWTELDSAVFSKLHRTNTISKRVQLLEDTIYTEASKIFGVSKSKQKQLHGKSRRTKQCILLIQEKNKIQSKISLSGNPMEITALKDLLLPIREKIKSFRRAEKHRKKRWLFKRAQQSFKTDPYSAGKNLLDPRSSIGLSVDQEVLDHHKSNIVQDEQRNTILNAFEGLPEEPIVHTPFSTSSFSEKEFLNIVHTRRNKSSPGLNQIPYKVYKKCTQVRSFLFDIFTSCLKTRHHSTSMALCKGTLYSQSKAP